MIKINSQSFFNNKINSSINSNKECDNGFSDLLNSSIDKSNYANLSYDTSSTLVQTPLTLRCLLGSINLPKPQMVDYSNFLKHFSEDIIQLGTPQEIARDIAKLFEGGGVTGNFDGQGLSLGYLQWNIGSGTLQPLLRQMAFGENTRLDFDAIFGEKAEEVRKILKKSKQEQLSWARSINNSKNKIIEPWNTYFNKLLQNEKFVQIQDQYAKPYFNKAKSIVEDDLIGVKTVRGYVLAFDIAVQNGGVKPKAKQLIVDALKGKDNELTNPNHPALTPNGRDIIRDLHNRLASVTDEETKKLYYTAAAVAITSRDKYAKDVWSRKSTIVSGTGIVHGTHYAFSEQILSDNALT